MKNSNLYFLLSWFLIGFGLSYILLNSSKWVGGKNADDSAFSNNYDKYGYIESRQNLNSTNYVRLPKFRGSNDRLFSTSGSSNFAQQTKTASHIEANYSVRINEKNDMKVGQTSSAGYSSFGSANNNFSSNNAIRNNNNNNSNNISSELSNINSQIASIRSSYTVKSTQEPENQKKSIMGF